MSGRRRPTPDQIEQAGRWLAETYPPVRPSSSIYLQPDPAPSHPLPQLRDPAGELAEDAGLSMIEGLGE